MALNTLERIVELGDRLIPLGHKTQGMRIEAGEWNTLVEVLAGVLEIDRAQDSGQTAVLANRFAAREHEHLGAVTTAWLDAELQARLGDGGSTVGLRATVSELTQKVSALGAEVARLTAALDDQQRSTDRAATAELDRARKLGEFEKRFGGLEDMRSLVGTLSGQVGGISKNVDAVLALRQSLLDASGAPIDVAGLQSRVEGLADLRANFNGIDGKPLRIRDLELQLNELEQSSSSGGLDQRFSELEVTLGDKLELELSTRVDALQSSVDASLLASAAGLRTELDSKLESARGELEQNISSTLLTQHAQFRSEVDARLTVGLEATRESATKAASEAVDARLASLPAQIRDSVALRASESEAALRASLQREVAETVRAEILPALSPFEQRMKELEGRVTRELLLVPARVDESVVAAMAEVEGRVDSRITAGLAAVRTSVEATTSTRVQSEVSSALATLDTRVADSVTRGLAGLDAKIATSVGLAVGDLPGEIQGEVALQLQDADVSGQLQRTSTALVQQWRGELGVLGADLRALVSANTRDTVASVNQQILAAQRSAVQESVARSTSLLAAAEQRLGVRIEQRPGNVVAGSGSVVIRPTIR
jgi:hypothetical protein